MSSSGDSDISDSGEGKTLKATTAIGSTAIGSTAIGSTAIGASPKRKRSQRTTDTFRLGVKTKHKVDLVDVTARAGSSSRRQCKCVLCGVAKENKVPPPAPTTHVFLISLSSTPSKTGLWRDHAAKCKGIVTQAERRQLSAYVGAGGEAHRQKLVDTYKAMNVKKKGKFPPPNHDLFLLLAVAEP